MQPPPLVDNLDQTPADRVDALLRRHCLGEGLDGLLVETKECRRGLRPNDQALVERVNEARLGLWKWMGERQPGADPEALRRAWRDRRLEAVICGGWVQQDDGTWGEKKC
jgi:hypothetical protein